MANEALWRKPCHCDAEESCCVRAVFDEKACVSGGLWKFLAFGSLFCIEVLLDVPQKVKVWTVFFQNTYCRHITRNHWARICRNRISEVALANTAEDVVTLPRLHRCCHCAEARQRERQVDTKVREQWGPWCSGTPIPPRLLTQFLVSVRRSVSSG